MKRLVLVLAVSLALLATACDTRVALYLPGGAPVGDSEVVGAGAELAVIATVEPFQNVPTNLDWLIDDPATVDVADTGTRVSAEPDVWTTDSYREPEGVVLSVVPRGTGTNAIEFVADNADSIDVLRYTAETVDEVELETTLFGQAIDLTASAPARSIFGGVRLELTATCLHRFFGAARPILGRPPLVLEAPPGSGTALKETSTLVGLSLVLGEVPHVVTVSEGLTGARITANVVDLTGIAALAVLDPPSAPVEVGRLETVQVVPRDAAGQDILGRSPASPEVVLSSEIVKIVSAADGQLVFEGVTPGTATVTITWGNATAAFDVTVVAPPGP